MEEIVQSQVVSNSVIHGYQGQEDKLVTIEASISKGILKVLIEDQGVGIEDVEQPCPGFTDPENGLGLFFMQSFMDDVHDSTLGKGIR